VIAATFPHRAALGRVAWCTFAAIGILLAIAIFVVVGPTIANSFGFDARAYWGFPRDPLYAGPGTANGYGIYRYSPAFVPLMTLFTAIPWPVFVVTWATFLFGVYLWMTGRNWLPLLAFPAILFELSMGNIHLLLAAAIVLGFRWPATWSFVLLTKVTPGIGLLWFAVRREWRALAIAFGATLAIALVGFVVAPGAWVDWLRSLQQTEPSIGPNVITLPLAPRLLVAAALVVWGARTNRRWTVVVAATLAVPTLWSHSLSMLVGIVALRRGLPESINVPSWLPDGMSVPPWLRFHQIRARWRLHRIRTSAASPEAAPRA
jgi:hypothetical protein